METAAEETGYRCRITRMVEANIRDDGDYGRWK